MANAKLAVSITADDGTKKGIDSAGKRFSDLKKKAGAVGHDDTGLKRFSRQLGSMERAASKGFGRSSVLSSVGERFGVVQAASEGLGEAKAAGGGGMGSLLGMATSGLGLFAGAAVAAGAAAFAFVDSWSRDAAALDRLSQATGMAARDIDALAAANRTVGITREQTEASLENLGKRLNDAQYGRNNQVLALDNQLGLGIKRDANGTPDVNAFLIALSGKIAGNKNPYTQQEIADRYGVSALLPELRKGSAQFAADLADARNNAVSRDGNDTALGAKILSQKTRAQEFGERGLNAAGAKTAAGAETAFEAGKGLITNSGGAIRQAAGAVGHALSDGAHVVQEGFGKVDQSLKGVVTAIAQVAREAGVSVKEMLTTARIESHFDPNAHAKTSSAAGLYQFLDKTGEAYGIAGNALYDPRRSAEAYVREMRHDRPILEQRLGHTATDWEAYLLHQQGLGGATKILTGDQSQPAIDVLGRKQVLNNGGDASMSLGEFQQVWQKRYAGADAANRKQGIYDMADGRQNPARAEVTIKLAGAPQGTVTSVNAAPSVNVKVERAMISP